MVVQTESLAAKENYSHVTQAIVRRTVLTFSAAFLNKKVVDANQKEVMRSDNKKWVGANQ